MTLDTMFTTHNTVHQYLITWHKCSLTSACVSPSRELLVPWREGEREGAREGAIKGGRGRERGGIEGEIEGGREEG